MGDRFEKSPALVEWQILFDTHAKIFFFNVGEIFVLKTVQENNLYVQTKVDS